MDHAPDIVIIGAGPAGLIAAETLAAAGRRVVVHERMPSPARKLLMAGRGGLNLTHSEPLDRLLTRYGAARPWLEPAITAFPPAALVAWAEGLGQPCFTGSSGRIFPSAMKASPLLRGWLTRLAGLGVRLVTRSEWRGWTPDGALAFADQPPLTPRATLLALGGASWPRLGADGGWTAHLPHTPLRPANGGFRVAWSERFRRFAGTPLKRIAASFAGQSLRGEAMITADGIEGGAIYALSAALRDATTAGPATLTLDLRPDLDAATLARRLAAPRRGQSLANFLRRSAGLSPVAIGLVQEALHRGAPGDLSLLIKRLPVIVEAPQPLAQAISTAGGVPREALDEHFMLRARPGVFIAGEMLDWEAPTGGYLLQACFSTGVAAARGILLSRPAR